MQFEKKISLVTGANRGIGKAIAKKLLEKNVIVIGTATQPEGVKKISKYLHGQGLGIQLNICDSISIKLCLEKIKKNFGLINILINNAGITQDNLLIKMKENQWDSVINTNLTGTYRISKEVIPGMLKKNYGRIVNIGSVSGFVGNPGQTNYSASKFGLIGFTHSLSREVAKRGITVNMICPGFIDTDMTRILSEKHKEKILSFIPINRFGSTKDVAHAAIFLASDEASYITGETIHVNGGMYMK
ncbi:3-oxoacyl-[acyl-carrier-protein] reductase [Wigglesworthia glossinidia endosymbiont of Glossina morsitans morsitans (Yale colony)]|uniref:3-oxoacyl-[acyl-carrier-protein] reductase n=1 Tax=Wigglesworthia glossinidia endosymbiont of Glossina morsitans morsitans (Yale colony) TaxID=1142511 RepID=H6Q5Q1_WIGGL|nr:3-oxoacyl-[acyl-carrier-protein] reductase [Wigglesworthia glossinidia]AFA40956.1 3-oxoacyl-[acyl-carrier-protein] reductase [Wigglesworthia glossinidia endosymbiont of Glossina morsitans morsitans (Yale colony)]